MSVSVPQVSAAVTGRAIGDLLVIVGVAVLVRWMAYTGYFGSDEVTYVLQAFKLLDGDWRVDDYVGANRLGMNIPTAAFAAVFGRTEWGAALFPITCAIAEVMLVWWVSLRMFGARAAFFAGLLMASLPTHAHFAGRIMADTPLTLTITASFVLFYEAERRRWSAGYLLAGVFAGLSFWIKPVTLFVFAIFLAYPLVVRRWDWRWAWMAAGLLAALAANCALFWALTDNFWFIFDTMRARSASGYLEEGVSGGDVHTAPTFYLSFLLLKIYHTGLVGWLALAGIVALIASGGAATRASASPTHGAGVSPGRYLAFWAVGLLAILSVLPVSIDPWLWIPKQTNYMLIFVAPLCVLGGFALTRLSTRWSAPVAAAAVGVGLVFALLLQASVAVFTANSWATLDFIDGQPRAQVAVMSNAYRAAMFRHLVGGDDVSARVSTVASLVRPVDRREGVAASRVEFAVIDAESFAWDGSRPFPRPEDVPSCWIPESKLVGRPTGAGSALVRALLVLAHAAPSSVAAPVVARLERLTTPRPAVVYRVPEPGC